MFKINLEKSKELRLSAWRVGVPLPGPFLWSDGLIHIFWMSFGPEFLSFFYLVLV